jgi:hypothetical protein
MKRKTEPTIMGMDDKGKKTKKKLKPCGIEGSGEKNNNSKGIRHDAGCRREAKTILLRLRNVVVDKTTRRRRNAAENPRRKDLAHVLGHLSTRLKETPRKINANHTKKEKKDNPLQRLRL